VGRCDATVADQNTISKRKKQEKITPLFDKCVFASFPLLVPLASGIDSLYLTGSPSTKTPGVSRSSSVRLVRRRLSVKPGGRKKEEGGPPRYVVDRFLYQLFYRSSTGNAFLPTTSPRARPAGEVGHSATLFVAGKEKRKNGWFRFFVLLDCQEGRKEGGRAYGLCLSWSNLAGLARGRKRVRFSDLFRPS
jgi:hypothetical protein